MTREEAERVYGATSVAAQVGSVSVTTTMYGPVPQERWNRELAEAKRRAYELAYVRPEPRERRMPSRLEGYYSTTD